MPWYIWFGNYIETAMKSWGVPTVFMLSMVSVGGWLAYRHGDTYVETTIETNKAQAASSQVVANAVIELTRLANDNQRFQERVAEEHKAMMTTLDSHSTVLNTIVKDDKLKVEVLTDILDTLKSRSMPE